MNGRPADTSEMYKVHTMFRREFGLLPELVRRVREGDGARSRLVADHIELLCMILETHHQSEDESLWPRLMERGTPNDIPLVQLMESHHEGIGEGISTVGAELEAWVRSAGSDERRALGDALDRLVTLLREHMALEEERILPLVEKYVTAAEWEEMVQKGSSKVRREDIPLIFGMIMYEGGPEIGPPEVRLAMRDVASQAFASHSRRLHGTATPPRSSELASVGLD